MYIFVIEDGNGKTKIVALWMVVKEDEALIRGMHG